MKLKVFLLFLVVSLSSNAQTGLVKINPIKAKASSAYKNYGPAENAIDGDIKTYWNPKNKGNGGNGESIELDLGKNYDIKVIKILPGFGDPKYYKRNNRPKRISVLFDGANEKIVDLEDTYGFKEIEVNKNVRKIEVKILERIVGSSRTAGYSNYISELEFFAINPEIKNNFEKDMEYLSNNTFGYNEVIQYQKKHKNIGEYLFDTDVQKWENLIKNKLTESVNIDMQDYQNEINNISPVFASIESLDQLSREIDNKYPSKYSGSDQMQKTKNLIRAKKGELVGLHNSRIAQKINGANTLQELESLENRYFNNIVSNDAVGTLVALINQNENRIRKEIEIRRQEQIKLAEARKREQEEKARIAEEERINEIKRLMNETTETGEPTQWQMQFALMMQLEAKNQKLERMSDVEAKDAVTALVALFGSAAKGTRSELKSFEKYNCEKAQGKPGFNCDYVADIAIRGGMAESYYGGLLNTMGSSEVSTARFSKIKGVWAIVQFIE